jgi:ectoine hydroxylase-related dioxygenase (phytanoyl-CoA dioxygenase family)
MVMCCAMYDKIFIDLFDHNRLIDPFDWILGSGCIVYAYTSSSMPPDRGNYSTRIHVDCPRLIPGYVTNVGAIICLDDFTADNGATWFLPGSHHREEAPAEGEFFDRAERLLAPAGAVWYFNTRLWHAGGVNHTNRWRHALTINMCRPYMKQRLDIPRLLQGRNLEGVSERALQKLGFYAQTPASLDEYYAPPNQRKFRQRYE